MYKKNNMYSGTLLNASLILPLPTSPVDVMFNRMSLESCCDIISIYLEALRILVSEWFLRVPLVAPFLKRLRNKFSILPSSAK